MGRKLNVFEETRFLSSDANPTEQDQTRLSHTQHLQRRIAEQLGVSVAQLRRPGDLPNAAHVAEYLARGLDTALSRECVDLIEAYTRIADPEQRLRCLRAVRDAATSSDIINPVPKGE